ncbi:MAG TPA: SDR family oxidoreductase [Planctomycetota bacterium]|nr:SDR family oxidoreductase [Planctomycetota bacterium]
MIDARSSLSSRVALVVGAARGLGLAIAQAYAREGARVVLADRDAAAATAAASTVAGSEAIALDIADPAAIGRAVDDVVARHGRLDIAVNCAAICLVDTFTAVSPERWDAVFAVNARGAFFCIQHAARAMIPRRHGRIITVSTPASRLGFPLFASYGASKAAVDSMSRAAAVALAPHGITVNTIVPGRMTGGMIDALELDLAQVTGKPAAELAAERTKGLPMGRRVDPAEVAEAAVWLASDAAAYVTAERFNFTGGMEVA